MAPNPRVVMAFRAMKSIGISEKAVKPVLKRLLRLYDKNWDAIEDENYRVLADAIFDQEDAEDDNCEKQAEMNDEEERPLKRKCLKLDEGLLPPPLPNSCPAMDGTLKINPKMEETELPIASSAKPSPSNSLSSPVEHGCKGKAPVSHKFCPGEWRPNLQRSLPCVNNDHVKDPAISHAALQNVHRAHTLRVPKDEPFTDDMPLDQMPQYEVPIAVIHPDSTRPEESHVSAENGQQRVHHPLPRRSSASPVKEPDESSTAKGNLEIASSSMGDVKILVSCNAIAGNSNFHAPRIDTLLELTQEKCVHSYKISDPNFSLSQLLKDLCDCFFDLATDSSHEQQETSPDASHIVAVRDQEGNIDMSGGLAARSMGFHCLDEAVTSQISLIPRILCGLEEAHHGNQVVIAKELRDESSSLVVVPPGELTPEQLRLFVDMNDVSKGEETMKIPWLNDINDEYPSTFKYLSRNIVFQHAYVNSTLSHIAAEHCCPCFGDCLSSSAACVCSGVPLHGFAYTCDGLVKHDFLEDCIAMTRDPQRQCLSFCVDCPLERSKSEDMPEPCKGHLKRTCIKECWTKCGCHKQCGNRVVQRGIKYKLQVFLTPGDKGWGLRTLENLPKGAFVCEYAGEILTNKELCLRNLSRARGDSNMRRGYPVMLDACWSMKKAMKDEEVLCLDPTSHGNVSRFINHRCLDANLIDIPVKMETQDSHYYHVALFTTREVGAMEELTRDYGIDFDNNDVSSNTFQCRCGSKFCRNMKRPNRRRRYLM